MDVKILRIDLQNASKKPTLTIAGPKNSTVFKKIGWG